MIPKFIVKSWQDGLTRLLIIFVYCFFALFPYATVRGQTVRMKDGSDWWSILNDNYRREDSKAAQGELDDRNFEVASVKSGSGQFERAAAKLGKAKIVQRGDASSGREQVCYVSPRGQGRVHLVFEFGEVESNFYLFVGGRDWKGSNLCVRSKKVSAALSTASGLKLGMTRNQLEAILGKPDFVVGDRLIYSRRADKRTSAEEFETLRKEYPEKLSDQAAHQRFDFQTVVVYIEARFANSRLTYLAVSKTS